ncbi:hypothetical protein PYW08_006511 [Mythimna loreyi]|uniref:Uncharacterized protein n=1 Tax=Mythimna loreyi TaxID=667449 RepID=A0ACC2QN65_9NEOP|nr:hypothetical protein PYW08_006511 [Mythimna loreyi]
MNSKFFSKNFLESDERSESDAASRRSSGSEMEEELVGNSGRDSRSFRKRTKSEDGQSSSDNVKGSAPKIPTGSRGGAQSRGRGRGLTAQESAQRAEKLAAEGCHPGAVSAGERPPRQAGGAPDAGADSAEEARRSFGEMMVAALRDMGRKRLAKPSSKGKTVLKHAASLSEAFDKALDKSVAKLRAELRAELRAGPAGPGAVRREAVGGGSGQGQGQSQPQPQPEAGNQLLTLIQTELAAFRRQRQQQQFQLQIQRQLSLLEGIEVQTLKEQLGEAISLIGAYQATVDSYMQQVGILNDRLTIYEKSCSCSAPKRSANTEVSNLKLSAPEAVSKTKNIALLSPRKPKRLANPKVFKQAQIEISHSNQPDTTRNNNISMVEQNKVAEIAVTDQNTECINSSGSVILDSDQEWTEVKHKKRQRTASLYGTANSSVTSLKAVEVRTLFKTYMEVC